MLLGSRVYLNLQLPDGRTDRFVRARVWDAGGTEHEDSPFALPHLANGLYRISALDMPATDELVIQYQVFEDSGFTTPDADYGLSLDEVERTFLPDEVNKQEVKVLGEVASLVLEVDIRRPEIEAVVEVDPEL